MIQARLVERLGWPNRGIVPRSDITGFNWSNRPVVLTEVGFLTNPGEDRALKTATTVIARRPGCATACSPTCTPADFAEDHGTGGTVELHCLVETLVT